MKLEIFEPRTLLAAEGFGDETQDAPDASLHQSAEELPYHFVSHQSGNGTEPVNSDDEPSMGSVILGNALPILSIAVFSYLTGLQASRIVSQKLFHAFFANEQAYLINQPLFKQALALGGTTLGSTVILTVFYNPWTDANFYAKIIAWSTAMLGFSGGFLPTFTHSFYQSCVTGVLFGRVTITGNEPVDFELPEMGNEVGALE